MSKQKVLKWNTNHAAPTYINMPYVYSVAKYLAEYFQPTASYGGGGGIRKISIWIY